uniref:Nudix hydrolase domain-containing protein n=1 Tax=Clastoptera arizonana TaxID=38151 RepID=A0A1B6D243_9HEMI
MTEFSLTEETRSFHDTKCTMKRIHFRCRNNAYPQYQEIVSRFEVPDDKVLWFIDWDEYKPQTFSANSLEGQPWADPDINSKDFNPKWNCIDGHLNRKSYICNYDVVDLYPLNPIGRTGLKGRGILGRWGPNHAGDSFVTRWKRKPNNEIEYDSVTNKPVLQFVSIQKKSGEWGFPGGMVDPGENVTNTLKREFIEEALNDFVQYPDRLSRILHKLDLFFSKGRLIYKGYVDDPRNTDNSWVECIVVHFHDDSGDMIGSIPLSAGDDACNVTWMDLSHDLMLYSTHHTFIKDMAKKMDCHL